MARSVEGVRGLGANQVDLGSFNEATIIETIRQAGLLSRTEISARTGLTQQSVSRILRTLIDRGLVIEEDAQRRNQLGKPRTPVRLRPDAGHAVGVLVDPEAFTLILADLTGAVVARQTLHAEVEGAALVDTIAAEVMKLIAEAGVAETTMGVGVAVPGPISPAGDLLELPLHSSWRNIHLGSALAQATGLHVVVEHDGTAAATGERWVGGGDRSGDFAFIYVGTGVGSGLVINGQVYRGQTGNAGQFGQLVAVRTGQFDDSHKPAMVSELNPTAALPDLAVRFGWSGAKDFASACEAFGSDPAVDRAVDQIAEAVGEGVVALLDLLDLDLVVVGGPAFHPAIRERMLQLIHQAANGHPTAAAVRDVRVEASHLPQEAAAVGAASLIFHDAFAPRAWVNRTPEITSIT